MSDFVKDTNVPTNGCISRQAAISVVGFAMADSISITREDWNAIIEALEALPSAQPEPEIIRCKDCLMHGVCRFERGLGLDGYCSQAERRTDG